MQDYQIYLFLFNNLKPDSIKVFFLIFTISFLFNLTDNALFSYTPDFFKRISYIYFDIPILLSVLVSFFNVWEGV